MVERYSAVCVFEEACHKNDHGSLLFRPETSLTEPTPDVDGLLSAVLGDVPLCGALTRTPFLVTHCAFDARSLGDGLCDAMRAATAAGAKLKLSTPNSVQSALLQHASQHAPPSDAACLVPVGESHVFHVAAVYGACWFYSAQPAAVVPPREPAQGSAAALHCETAVCRAFFKLSEAMIEDARLLGALTADGGGGGANGHSAAAASAAAAAASTSQTVCIDIGAAPGGWTDLLSRYRRVVAVDPGLLDERIAARPLVTHLRMLLSHDAADTGKLRTAMAPATQAAFVVCDANIPPAEAAKLVCHLAASGLVADRCRLVLTLKAPFKVRAVHVAAGFWERQEHEAVEALGAGWGEFRRRHLFANTAHECTLTAVYRVPLSQNT